MLFSKNSWYQICEQTFVAEGNRICIKLATGLMITYEKILNTRNLFVSGEVEDISTELIYTLIDVTADHSL